MTPDTSSVYVFVRKHRRVRLRLRLLSVVAVDGRRPVVRACAHARVLFGRLQHADERSSAHHHPPTDIIINEFI